MEVAIVKNVELFPEFLEFREVFNDVITIQCAFSKEGALNCDGDLIVLGFMYSHKTVPDFVCSVKPSDMNHLVLRYVVGNQDLCIDIIGVPDAVIGWIICWIRLREITIYVRLNSGKTKDAADSLTLDYPVRIIKRLLHLGDAGVDVIEFYNGRRCLLNLYLRPS